MTFSLTRLTDTWATGNSFQATDFNKVTQTADSLLLIPVAKSAAYTALASDLVVCTAATGFTVTLPTGLDDGTHIGVRVVSGGGTVTVACSGSDHIDVASTGPTSTTCVLGQTLVLQYNAALSVWYIISNVGATAPGLSVVTGKTLTVNNTVTLAGTDGTTLTLPSVSGKVPLTSSILTNEVYEDFTAKSAGAPVTADSGQTWTLLSAGGSVSLPVIAGTAPNAYYTNADTTAQTSASYLIAQLAATGTYMEADFQFASAGSTNGGTFGMICFTNAVSAPLTSPAHLVFKQTSYDYGVWVAGTYTILGTVTYASIGTSPAHVEWASDPTTSTAWVRGPDGVVTTFSDSRIGSATPAPYFITECYYAAANTDHHIQVKRCAASSAAMSTPSNTVTRAQALRNEGGLLAGAITTSGISSLSNKTLLEPKVDYLCDLNGFPILNLPATASAANFVQINNNTAGFPPYFSVQGSDANIDFEVFPKGSGASAVYVATGQTPTFKAAGVDTNLDINMLPKGTGVLKSKGVAVVDLSSTQTVQNKTLDGTNTFPTLNQSTTGNAGTATKLATARNINGVAFDGTAAITVYPNMWQPSDSGLIAWNYDPVACFTGNATLAGYLNIAAIPIRAATTITNVIIGVYAAGVGLTSAQNFAALYQGGNLLAATADQTTAWGSTGVKTMALTSAQAVTAGVVWVVWFANASSTLPSFWSGIGGGSDTVATLGTPDRWAFGSSGNTTAMPGTASAAGTWYTYWAAVS